MSEFLFLGVLALLVIGPKQLPELARNLGRFMNELRRAADSFTADLRDQTRIDFDLQARRRAAEEAARLAAEDSSGVSPGEADESPVEPEPHSADSDSSKTEKPS